MADQRDPWEIYAPSAPASISGPAKTIDPAETERLRFAGSADARDERRLTMSEQNDTKQDTNSNFSHASTLRGDYDSLPSVKNYTQALPVYGAGLQSAPDPAGDQNLIYAYAKVMDPNSVVREGEQESVANGQTFIDRTTQNLKKQLNGEGTFTPEYRKRLREEMANRMGQLNQSFIADRVRFKQTADRNGINPLDVVGEHPGARFQELSKKVLGRDQQQLDYNGQPIEQAPAAPDAASPGTPPVASPAAPIDPNGRGDIGFGVAPGAQSNLSQEQRSGWAAFIAKNPKPTAQQVQAASDLFGLNLTNSEEIAKGLAAGGTLGEIAELPAKTVQEAADRTVDGSTGSSLASGVVDAVPFAPQIGAVIDTLGGTQGRPNAFNSDKSLADTYAFNRDANNLALTKAQDAHPLAYGLGQAGTLVAGQLGAARALPALGSFMAEGGLAAQIGKAAPVEAAYGAAYGAGRNPDDQLKGALAGGVSAAAGGALGRGAVGALGAVVAPSAGKLGALYSSKVRPTLGQRYADSGIVGSAINGAEEAMQSFPGLGYAVRGARQGARDEFERGAFNKALNEIGDELPASTQLGTEANAYMQDAFKKGYDETLPRMRAVEDEEFKAGTQSIRDEVANGALADDSASRFNKIISAEVDRRVVDGAMNGESLKAAISKLGERIRGIRSSPNGDRDLASKLEDYADELKASASRHSDPEDVARLAAIDKGYAVSVRLEDAAAMRGGDPARFTPKQLDRSVQKNSGGVRSRSYLRGDALLQDYATAGQSLVDRLPNSGTPERLLMTQGMLSAPLGALGYASPIGALGAAAATIPYAPGIRRATQGLLAPRQSARLNTLGDLLRRNASLGGAAATPLLLQNGSANGN